MGQDLDSNKHNFSIYLMQTKRVGSQIWFRGGFTLNSSLDTQTDTTTTAWSGRGTWRGRWTCRPPPASRPSSSGPSGRSRSPGSTAPQTVHWCPRMSTLHWGKMQRWNQRWNQVSIVRNCFSHQTIRFKPKMSVYSYVSTSVSEWKQKTMMKTTPQTTMQTSSKAKTKSSKLLSVEFIPASTEQTRRMQ